MLRGETGALNNPAWVSVKTKMSSCIVLACKRSQTLNSLSFNVATCCWKKRDKLSYPSQGFLLLSHWSAVSCRYPFKTLNKHGKIPCHYGSAKVIGKYCKTRAWRGEKKKRCWCRWTEKQKGSTLPIRSFPSSRHTSYPATSAFVLGNQDQHSLQAFALPSWEDQHPPAPHQLPSSTRASGKRKLKLFYKEATLTTCMHHRSNFLVQSRFTQAQIWLMTRENQHTSQLIRGQAGGTDRPHPAPRSPAARAAGCSALNPLIRPSSNKKLLGYSISLAVTDLPIYLRLFKDFWGKIKLLFSFCLTRKPGRQLEPATVEFGTGSALCSTVRTWILSWHSPAGH